MARTKNIAQYIRAKLASNPELEAQVADERLYAEIATKVHALRNELGFTQIELAKKVDSQQSVISRIESVEYEGHSIDLLRRIAVACRRKLSIEFLPIADNETETTYDFSAEIVVSIPRVNRFGNGISECFQMKREENLPLTPFARGGFCDYSLQPLIALNP